MANQFVKALDKHADRRERMKRSDAQGYVISTTADIARVRVNGSGQAQDAKIPSGINVSAGDTCDLVANQTSNRVRWIISNAYSASRPSSTNPEAGVAYPELFPPNNLRNVDLVPHVITVAWDAPVRLDVTIEMQAYDTPSINGTLINSLLSKGSYAIIASESTVYVRTRCIAPDGQRSAWSTWLAASPYQYLPDLSALTIEKAPIGIVGRRDIYGLRGTPTRLGEMYLATDTEQLLVAVGTSSDSDWVVVGGGGGGGGGVTFNSGTLAARPTTAIEGDMYWANDELKLFIAYDTTDDWIEVDRQYVIAGTNASKPIPDFIGQLYYALDTDQLYYAYNVLSSTNWREIILGAGSGATAQEAYEIDFTPIDSGLWEPPAPTDVQQALWKTQSWTAKRPFAQAVFYGYHGGGGYTYMPITSFHEGDETTVDTGSDYIEIGRDGWYLITYSIHIEQYGDAFEFDTNLILNGGGNVDETFMGKHIESSSVNQYENLHCSTVVDLYDGDQITQTGYITTGGSMNCYIQGTVTLTWLSIN